LPIGSPAASIARMARPNRLAHESSPYLLQHAHNPVDWYPWGDEAFDRARAEDKPVLLSIGYSACHWCHVMERECFDDPEIAALMNELFVSIKVDREERPDVDDVYMKAVQLLIGRGGWPLTAFLTPDRRPFHGGTYFPPVDRHGMPGFPRVLRAVAEAYRHRRAEVDRTTHDLVAGVDRIDASSPTTSLDRSLPTRAAETLLRHVDREHGGLGGAPKFPHTQALQLFLRQYAKTGRRELLDAVALTCDRMAAGGMYDHIGGGFHRYSVDERWLVPHFEKMLYDNAQLPRLYLDLHVATGDAAPRGVVVDTLDYLLREMRDPGGGFYSATDADSEGEEGRFFVWTPGEVAALLGAADADLACRHWGITPEGNFEGRSIAHRAADVAELATSTGRQPDEVRATIERSRERLYAARARRVPPLRDEKIIVAWNALVIGALAEAGRVLDVPAYVDAAEKAVAFIDSAMRRSDGRLLHVWARGAAKQLGFLDDHAFLASALLDLYEATADRRHLERARELVTTLERRFHDPRGGYFFTPDDGETLITRSKSGADGALPSGNAVAALVHLRLHALTGDDVHQERAEEILHLYHDAAAEQPFGFATYLEALERYAETPVEVVIVGRADDSDARAMWDVVRTTYLPHRVLVRADLDDPNSPAPARERPSLAGRPTAYVCHRFTCSAPTTDPAELARLLADATRP
jgi:uncharacterized protein YyaL (SSP411 family)